MTDDGPAGGRSRKGIGRRAAARARARASQPAHRRRPISVYQTTGTYVDRPPPFSPGLHLFGLPVLTCIVPAHDVTVRGGRLTCAPQRKWIGRRPSSIEPLHAGFIPRLQSFTCFTEIQKLQSMDLFRKLMAVFGFLRDIFFTRESCMHGVLNKVYL